MRRRNSGMSTAVGGIEAGANDLHRPVPRRSCMHCYTQEEGEAARLQATLLPHTVPGSAHVRVAHIAVRKRGRDLQAKRLGMHVQIERNPPSPGGVLSIKVHVWVLSRVV